MALSELTSISPIDGRYRNKVVELSEYYSEFALIRYRVLVEIEYFIALCDLPLPQLSSMDTTLYPQIRNIYKNFSESDALRIKEIEKTTNHDVKAVEYFLKERFEELGIGEQKEFIHFGLTSQDVNNTAVPYGLSRSLSAFVLPLMLELIEIIEGLANEWSEIPMLAHTHGQPASPTTLGKEMQVFAERLRVQKSALESVKIGCKFGGATGNMNAHKITYPEIDWINFANTYVENALGLSRQQTTTQIEHYDNMAAVFDAMGRINNILIDFSRDIWTYISFGYFKQRIKEGEIGSSAMPHKVNPIDFENAEGNLGLANATFSHLSSKLPVSRLQRDLTDSTVIRNIGVPVAHSCIAYKAIMTGMKKLLVNESAMNQDLEENWVVVAEAIQSILRREGVKNPYEQLKDLTRTNTSIGKTEIHGFIDTLEVSELVREELKRITPQNYTGYRLNDYKG